MDIILYSFRRCPYAMRARMALRYAGIEYEHREIELKNKPASMLEYSPKATVPVMVVAGKVIDESLDIALWAVEQNDPDSWWQNRAEAEQQEMMELIANNDDNFKKHLDRYKYPTRYVQEFMNEEGEPHNEELVTEKAQEFSHYHRVQTDKILEAYQNRLAQHKYLLGDDISLADIAIMPFIRQFSNVEPEWWQSNGYLDLQKWLDELLSSDLFNAVMKKYPLWQGN